MSTRSESDSFNSDNDEESEFLDPRIQVELEKLNTCTDEINKLEIELDEANTTFRILLNESMRRLKLLTCKLGSCIDRARPYYEAVDIAKKAQAECQRAAVKFQRANEIHQAAKETVALAETRFLSNQHEWQFDSAWQEMLNHAIIKVTEAEHQRTESGQEHQKRATLFNVAEQRVATLEQKLKRTIIKSRPYFEEKSLCQEQLDTQKKRIEELQGMISKVKSDYSGSLKRLEAISEEIHQRRRNKSGSGSPLPPRGPREPGVGAELDPKLHEEIPRRPISISYSPDLKKSGGPGSKWSRDDLENELDKFEVGSLGSMSAHTSSHVSESEDYDDDDLDELRQKVKELSMAEVRSDTWETELAESILRLDNAMLERECNRELRAIACKPFSSPLREQDCNRELTAITAVRPEVAGTSVDSTVSNSDSVISPGLSSSDDTDTRDSASVADKSPSEQEPRRVTPLSPFSEAVRPDGSSEGKTLDTVLAEEEKKRGADVCMNFVSVPLNFVDPPNPTKLERLSAVDLNRMVNEKETENTSKSILTSILNLKSGEETTKNEAVDNVDKTVETPDNRNSERRQSIGVAASKLLNGTKIESIRANINDNILTTIKDVSETVLNKLVRQDSTSSVIKVEAVTSPQQEIPSTNPFKEEMELEKDSLKPPLVLLQPSDSIIDLQAEASAVQPHPRQKRIQTQSVRNGSVFNQIQQNNSKDPSNVKIGEQ